MVILFSDFSCYCRYRADNANTIFITELKKYVPRPEMMDLFKITLSEAWYDQTNHLQDDSKQLQLQIKESEKNILYQGLTFIQKN